MYSSSYATVIYFDLFNFWMSAKANLDLFEI